MGHKSELNSDQGGLDSMHQYSMLQRFRANRDFKAVDKYKPKYTTPEEADEVRSKENSWWRTNAVTEEQKEVEQKTKVEKGRYLKELKALV